MWVTFFGRQGQRSIKGQIHYFDCVALTKGQRSTKFQWYQVLFISFHMSYITPV